MTEVVVVVYRSNVTDNSNVGVDVVVYSSRVSSCIVEAVVAKVFVVVVTQQWLKNSYSSSSVKI